MPTKIFKSYWFWIIVSIVIIIVLLVIYNNYSKSINTSSTKTSPAVLFPLKLGSTGLEVLNVQKYLNQNNNCGLKEDGIMGQDTVDCLNDILNVTEVDQNSYQNIILKNVDTQAISNALNDFTTGLAQDLSGWKKV